MKKYNILDISLIAVIFLYDLCIIHVYTISSIWWYLDIYYCN